MTFLDRFPPVVRNQGPAIAWALVIFIASSFSHVPGPRLGFQFEDKWHHLIVYGLLGFLVARAFRYQSRFPRLKERLFFWTWLTGTLYGISDEIHQYFVPGRFADVGDALADSLGAALGAWLFLAWMARRRRRGLAPAED